MKKPYVFLKELLDPGETHMDEFLELWPLCVEEAEIFMPFFANCGNCGFAWAKTDERLVWRGTKCPNCSKDGHCRWISAIVREEYAELESKKA